MTIDELIRKINALASSIGIGKSRLVKNGNTKHRTLLFNGKTTLIGVHKKSEIPEGTLNRILDTLGLKKKYLESFNKTRIKRRVKELFGNNLTEPVSTQDLDRIFSEENNGS